MQLRVGRFVIGHLWRSMLKIRLGGIHQQALQVQQRRRVIDRKSTNVTNPSREIRHHHGLAVGLGSKAALARSDPSEVAVRADFGDF